MQDPEKLEYALIVLWELLEHQAPLVEDRESEIFDALLRVRYSKSQSVRDAYPAASIGSHCSLTGC